MKTLRRLFLIGLFVRLALSPIYGFDIVADYSTNANPNGVWSYGWATALDNQFQLLTDPITFYSGTVAGWQNGLSLPDSCFQSKNYAANSIQDGTVIFNPGTIHLDPQSYVTMVRFTAPSNGSYEVTGQFRMEDTGTRPHNLIIQINTNLNVYDVNSGSAANGAEFPFEFPCTLAQNDTVDFIVAYSGTYNNLGTGLEAVILPATNSAGPPSYYSATEDYSETANPNGVWSYLWWSNSSLTQPPQILASQTYPVSGQTNIFAWWNGGTVAQENSVVVGVDQTENPYSESQYPNVIYEPNTLLEDPESLAVATRFTAPATGTYSLAGFFQVQDADLQSSGTGAVLDVLVNTNLGQPLFAANSSGDPLDTQFSFDVTNVLNQGDVVDFMVRPSTNPHYLSTGLNATVTPLSVVIISQPANVVVPLAGTAVFSVSNFGSGPVSYQWHYGSGAPISNNSRISGAETNQIVISNVLAADVTNYYVVVSNSYGTVISSPASLSILAAPVLIDPEQLPGGGFSFSFVSTNNQTYTVQEATNLAAPNWINYTNVTGNGSLLQVVVSRTNSLPCQFFRLAAP